MLSSRDTWGEAGQAMRAAGACSAPVTDAGGRFVGVLSADRGAGIAAGSAIGHAIDRAAAAVRIDDNLDDALAVLPPAVEADRRWVAVVDGDRVLCGVVTVHGIVRGYRSALHADATRFHGVSASADVTDIPVGEGAAIVGAEAAGPAVPDEVIVLSILRGGVLLPGADSAIFQAGDVVTALGPTRRLAEFRDRAIGADKAKTATT
ncbi:TrkA C-terminal domain-containing protein [Tomitella fengzijianii]|uniref:TrkA C-terminal domain-containing protein n=1 Tax=Tomitella fengzijianii TaxID=2597660 RepID=UPI002E26FFBC